MAITVARLLAEIGIDPRQFKAGLSEVKNNLNEAAQNFVVLEKAAEKASETQIKANQAVIASNTKYQESLLKIKEAEENVEAATRRVENATNRLATANEKAKRARQIANAGQTPDERKVLGQSADQAERTAANAANAHKDALLNLERQERALNQAKQNSISILEKESAAIMAQEEALQLATIQAEALAKAQAVLAESANVAFAAIERQNAAILNSVMEEKLGGALSAELNAISLERERNAIAAERWAEQIAAADAKALEADKRYWDSVIADGERATKARNAEAAALSAHALGVTKAWSSNLESVARRGREIGQQLSLSMSLPLAFVGVEAVKTATEYEFAIDKIRGQTNASKADIDDWAKEIQKISPQVGKLPKDLADGMYFVASAGYKGKEALDILTEAGKASEEGLGEVGKITHAVTSILFDYKNEVHSAAEAMDLLIAGTREGKLNIDQLAPALGRIMPLTASLGIRLNDVVAAVDSMTHAGLSVDRATTAIQTFLSKLATGGKQANKELKLVGMDTQQFLVGLQTDFLGTFLKVNAALEKHNQSLIDLSANGRSSAGILSLIGENAEYNAGIFARLNDVTGTSAKAWDAVKDSSRVALDQMKAAISDDLIKVGTDLAPTIVSVSHAIVGMADSFANLDPGLRQAIVSFGLFAAVIGPVIYGVSQLVISFVTLSKIVTGIRTLALLAPEVAAVGGAAATAGEGVGIFGAALTALSGPVGWTILAVAALGYGIYKLVDAYHAAETEGVKTTEQLKKEWDEHVAQVQAKAANAEATARLYKQVQTLSDKTNRTVDETHQLHILLNKLADLSPEIIKGYDANGNAIDFWRGKQEDLNKALAETARLSRITNAINTYGDRSVQLRQELGAAKARLNELRDKGLAYTKQAWVKYDGTDVVSNWSDQYMAETHGAPHKNQSDYSFINHTFYEQNSAAYNKALRDTTAEVTNLQNSINEINKQFHAMTSGQVEKRTPPKPPGPVDTGNAGFKVDGHLKDLGNEILKIGLENADTADIKNSCSLFISKVARELGISVPSIPVAKNLVDYWINTLGAKVTKRFGEVGAPNAGDLVAWHGTQFGSIKDKAGMGWHVGFGIGGGQVLDNTGARGGHARKMFDSRQAEFLTLPKNLQLGDAVAQAQEALNGKQKEAKETYNKQIDLITSLVTKQLELKNAINSTIATSNADRLAQQYEIENKKQLAGVITAGIRSLQKYNVELQRESDLHEKILDLQRTTRDTQNKAWLMKQFPGDQNAKTRQAISDMGIQNYRDIMGSGSKNGISMVQGFIRDKVAGLNDADIEKAKNDLNEMASSLQNTLNKNQGDKTEYSKALIKIHDITKEITDQGKLKELQKQIDEVLQTASDADWEKAKDNFQKIFEPMDRAMAANKAIVSGTFNQKNDEFRQWWDSNKESLFQLFQDFGSESVMSAMEQWSAAFDLNKTAEGIKNFNQQLGQAQLQAKILGDADPYQKWLDSMSKIDENGVIKAPDFGGKDPRQIFNQQQSNEAKTAMQNLRAETAKTSAEISAKSPFDAWLVSFEKFDQATGKMKLPPEFDRTALKIQFDLIQNQKMIQEFASGVKDIFGNMINDLKEKGFKGLFTSIAQGFDQLLFKMAVEYLESQIYQMLLSSMGGWLGGGSGKGGGLGAPAQIAGAPQFAATGKSASAGNPFWIGENGPELFVPGMDGYIVANHHLSNMMAGFSAGAKAGLSAGNTYNQYSSGAIGGGNTNYVMSGLVPGANSETRKTEDHVHLHFHSTFNVGNHAEAKQLEQHVYVQAQRRADRYNKRLG